MNGRLRAAKRLRGQGQTDAAIRELEKNLRTIKDNPAFDAGSDQSRIAQTFAGLALWQPDCDWWLKFKERNDWAAKWLPAHGGDTAVGVWAEVE